MSCSAQEESALQFFVIARTFENVHSTFAVLRGRAVTSSTNVTTFPYGGTLRIPCQRCSGSTSSNHHQMQLEPALDCTKVTSAHTDANLHNIILVANLRQNLVGESPIFMGGGGEIGQL